MSSWRRWPRPATRISVPHPTPTGSSRAALRARLIVPTGPGPGVAGAPPGPDPHLLAASAMVFVADPAAPVLAEDDLRHLIDVLRLRSGRVGDRRGRGRVVGPVPGGCRGRAPGVAGDGSGLRSVRRRAGGVPAPAGTGDHGGLRPGQGRPARVGDPEADRGGGGPHRSPPCRSVGGALGGRAGPTGRGPAAPGGPPGRSAVPPGLAARGDRGHALDRLAPVAGGSPRLAQPGGCRLSLVRPVVAVGPEGGWDAAELDRFGPGVGLGPTCCGPRRPPWPSGPSCALSVVGRSGRLRNHAA